MNPSDAASASSTYNHNNSRSNPSLLRTPTIPRKSPRKLNIWLDELVLFQAANKVVDNDSISEQNSPEETGILAVNECISADRNLHVPLSYNGLVIPLLQCFVMKITVPLLYAWKL